MAAPISNTFIYGPLLYKEKTLLSSFTGPLLHSFTVLCSIKKRPCFLLLLALYYIHLRSFAL